jgi:inosose dehydratase
MSIKVGTAPDSWGVWFPSHKKQTPWQRCMDEMSEAGYAGVELGPWGYFPNTANELKAALEKRGLELVAATCGGDFLDNGSVDGMLKTVDGMTEVLKHFPAVRYIVLLPAMYTNLETGELVADPDLNDEQWKRYVRNVQRAADHVTQKGLVACFHPHVDCHVQTEAQIERLLNDTNRNVQLCFDTGHHVYGGGEPVAFYRKHAARIPYIHIKDCDLAVKAKMDAEKWSFAKAVTKDIMVEPGKGSVDFSEFRKALSDKNYEGWVVVEQDLFPVKSFDIPLAIAKRTRQYLRQVGF